MVKRKIGKQFLQKKQTHDKTIIAADQCFKNQSYKQALEQYLSAFDLKPANFYACHKIGCCFEKIGNIEAARKAYLHAIKLSSDYFPAFISLAQLSKAVGEHIKAIKLLQIIHEKYPDEVSIILHLVPLMREQLDQHKDLIKLLQDFLGRNPENEMIKILIFHVMLDINYMSKSEKEEAAEIERLNILFQNYQKVLTPTPTPYPIALSHGVFFSAYLKIAEHKLFLENYAKLMRYQYPKLHYNNHALVGSRRKIRLGIYCSYFNKEHAIHWCFGAIFKSLSREKFELIHISAVEERNRTTVRDSLFCPVEAHYEFSTIEQAVKGIEACQLDILVYLDFSISRLSYELAFMRLAPLQCMMLGHPTTTGLSTIDYYISSKELEAEDAQKYYTEKLVLLDGMAVVYQKPTIEEEYSFAHFDLPADKNIYLCVQSMMKVHYGMDEVFAKIMDKDPEAVLVFVRGAQFPYLQKRWEENGFYEKYKTQIKVLDVMPLQEFFNLLKLGCVFLDTFPFGGGNTCFQSFAFGTPIVTFNNAQAKGRTGCQLYRRIGRADLICDSYEQYVQLAVRFGTDKKYRQEVSSQILDNHHKIFEDLSVVKEHEKFFERIVLAKRKEQQKKSVA